MGMKTDTVTSSIDDRHGDRDRIPSSGCSKLTRARVLAERRARTLQSCTQAIGILYPRPDTFLQPRGRISDAIVRTAAEHRLVALDVSGCLMPRMTVAQLYRWNAKLLGRVETSPETLFYATVDDITPTEAILAIDDEMRRVAQHVGSTFVGHAQGYVWRGEKWVRIAGVRDDTTVVARALRPILGTDDECAVCLEVLADCESSTLMTAIAPFTCGHVLCRTCSSRVTACPLCRSTRRRIGR